MSTSDIVELRYRQGWRVAKMTKTLTRDGERYSVTTNNESLTVDHTDHILITNMTPLLLQLLREKKFLRDATAQTSQELYDWMFGGVDG